MTHAIQGHYALKHSESTRHPEIIAALQEKASANRISCAAVHAVAASFKVPPAEVGRQADLIEMRLTRCILGLFGHEHGKKGTRKNLDPQVDISPALENAVRGRAGNDKVSCLDCWEIAKNLDIPRARVSSACEQLKIKIKPCQLGAF